MEPNNRAYWLIHSLLWTGLFAGDRELPVTHPMNGESLDSGSASALLTAIGKYDDKSKLNIILTLYVQMVTYIQEIRGRVERIVVGGSALIVLLDGWLVTRSNSVSISSKVVASIGILLFTGVLALVVRALQQQFHGYAQVIRKINEVQLVHSQGVFLQNHALYPVQWKDFGSDSWKEPIFIIAYPIQVAIGVFGVTAIWLI